MHGAGDGEATGVVRAGVREVKRPKDQQIVLLKYRGRSLCTRGDGSPDFWGEWTESISRATFLKKAPDWGVWTIPAAGGHFAPLEEPFRHEYEFIDWVGFSK